MRIAEKISFPEKVAFFVFATRISHVCSERLHSSVRKEGRKGALRATADIKEAAEVKVVGGREGGKRAEQKPPARRPRPSAQSN